MLNRSRSLQPNQILSRVTVRSPLVTSRFHYKNPQQVTYTYFSPITQVNYVQPILNESPKKSYLQYIPYQRTQIQYQTKQYIDRVPIQKKVIDYRSVKKIDYVPKERTVIDYFPIQHQINYKPVIVPQTKIDYVPVQTINQRLQYVPYQKKIVHYPNTITNQVLTSSRRILGNETSRSRYISPFKNKPQQQHILNSEKKIEQTYDTYNTNEQNKKRLYESRGFTQINTSKQYLNNNGANLKQNE